MPNLIGDGSGIKAFALILIAECEQLSAKGGLWFPSTFLPLQLFAHSGSQEFISVFCRNAFQIRRRQLEGNSRHTLLIIQFLIR
ncbi:MAG TPA: hypothetical protein VMF08_04800 [Candidatus Sulfotelmatobacter sp.]|nr:hypothetical protein [Candidatus Sulfotelmatobacter sp.]